MHLTVGLVIFLTTLLQEVFAFLRPPLPHKEEKKESVKKTDEEDTETKEVESREESTGKESKETVAVGKKSLVRLG
jgi:hypothetical protein